MNILGLLSMDIAEGLSMFAGEGRQPTDAAREAGAKFCSGKKSTPMLKSSS